MQTLQVGDRVESRLSGNRGTVVKLLCDDRVSVQMTVQIAHEGMSEKDCRPVEITVIYAERQLLPLRQV